MISILLPTRGRPHNMEGIWYSAHSFAENKNDLSIHFYVDDDDLVSKSMLCELDDKFRDQIGAVVGERITMSDMTNELYKTIEKPEIVMFAGDDILFRTPGWDKIVHREMAKYKDKIVLLGGDDGYNKETITHGFLHRNWIETVGYVVPPGYVGDYADTWVNDLAIRINRRVRIPIMTEHMHWAAGKGPMDKTMQEKNHRTYNVGTPAQVRYQLDEPKRIQDAQKLQNFIDNFAVV